MPRMDHLIEWLIRITGLSMEDESDGINSSVDNYSLLRFTAVSESMIYTSFVIHHIMIPSMIIQAVYRPRYKDALQFILLSILHHADEFDITGDVSSIGMVIG